MTQIILASSLPFAARYYGTYILVIIGAAITMLASAKVKSTYAKFASVAATCGLTGAQVAEKILRSQGINDVAVGQVSGQLTDHFNPSKKVVNLSESVYSNRSIAAIGVAAHECGHAVQHNVGYFPIKVRTMFVPIANFGSKLGMPILIIGFVLSSVSFLIPLGIILFSFGVIFHVITLPVEIDASKRALAILEKEGILASNEIGGAKDVLSAAAMTYVAAAASSLLQLIRIILIYGGGNKRDRR